ncbi:MAG TPA: cystathionine beta-synthase [Bdellovibrionales bacterium]|nr:cystathionine beta-synthase [Bdellovibrionales bacterium]
MDYLKQGVRVAKVFNNILETVGGTPLVKLNKVVPNDGHNYWAKVEFFNPGGSIKDRIAVSIIEEAERRGELKPGGTIIEATSGNTGMGLALVAAVKGYKAVFVLPDKMSDEKINTLRGFGAKVVITPTAVEPDDPRSHYSVAKKLVEITPNSFYANQYHNPDNPKRHYQTTGPEIWEQTGGKVDVFVAGAGTGGTLSGTGKFLKEKNPKVKIVGADPAGSILFDMFYHKKIINKPHPYKIEGIGEDMIPDNMQFQYFDDFVTIEDKESFLMCRELLSKEGLFVGPSAGGAVVAAVKYMEKIKEPKNVVIILPDSGSRYLSKAFNDAWMKEVGFLSSPLQLKTAGDLVRDLKHSERMISVKNTVTVLDVIKIFKENGISQVPVFADTPKGELVGLIDEGDLLYPLASGLIKPTDPIISFIKGSIVYVSWDDPLQKLAELFGQGYVALVKDQAGKLNIVTKIDLIEYLGGNH